MREILFRGKRADNGEWVYGYFVSQGKESYIFEQEEVNKGIDLGGYLDCCQMREVIPETLGHSTGLFDKNGKKIFEGDIVKTKYGRLCIVVWFSSQVHNGWDLMTVTTYENCVHTKYPDAVDLYKKENLEVIGNIHDNPELLGKK